MDTIFPVNGGGGQGLLNSALNVIDQIKERPSETYQTREINNNNNNNNRENEIRERTHIMETPQMMEIVADSISEEVSLSSAIDQRKRNASAIPISLNQKFSSSVRDSNEPLDERTQD